MNAEPNEIKTLLDYNCNYYQTELGMLYKEYKTLNQGELQKALLKCSNKLKRLHNKKISDGFLAVNQSIFKLTFWNEDKNEYETPKILLIKKNIDILEFNKIQQNIFNSWYKVSETHLYEINKYYQERKAMLEQQQKINHKVKANEKIVCSYCKANITRTNLSRHYKTNKTCLSLRMTNDEPPCFQFSDFGK